MLRFDFLAYTYNSVNFVCNFFLYLRGIFSLYSTRYYKRSIETLVNANKVFLSKKENIKHSICLYSFNIWGS